MAEILSKTQAAAAFGVKPSTISNWIARQKLTPPALRTDGKIDMDLARAQIGSTVDPMLSAASHARYGTSPASAPAAVPVPMTAAAPAWSPAQSAQQQILRARAVSSMVDAERKRRDFNAERGRYMLTSEVEAAWTRVLSEFLTGVEQSFADLGIELGLTSEQLVGIRRWWRAHREAAAKKNTAAASQHQPFVEDNAA